jgi:PTH2 family peptidyl-tRNA hydrolase
MANVQDRGPPSAAAIAIGTGIVAGLTGYFLGQARSIGVFGRSHDASSSAADSDMSDAEDEDEAQPDDLGELKTFSGNSEECKLVLAVRGDLKMTKGRCFLSRTFFQYWIKLSTTCHMILSAAR